ncbi:hypothetical protein HYH03_009973 [Edaphochlamys debaryana]|uniref:Uncharacterized protein n=1 Tax=Edaphochlamys debaryana TaxID=47281 RepID=A0A835XZD4_9CHLO|nr:hypothetical protein HYH03_009973 [Edaphochlamys debaryana]|eukprot:KAG2491813.1 hypothetical protein HYH03_009973 [Edaphochlamys debaryana]
MPRVAQPRSLSAATQSGGRGSAASLAKRDILSSLRSVPRQAERLLGQYSKTGPPLEPLSVAELEDLASTVESAVHGLQLGSDAAATQVLGAESICVALLTLASISVRLPAPSAGPEPAELEQQRRIGGPACHLLRRLLLAATPASSAATGRQASLAQGLLGTGALQAAAQQLVTTTTADETQPWTLRRCEAALACITQAMDLLSALAMSPASWSRRDLVGKVAAALAESHLLEHAARLQLRVWRAYPAAAGGKAVAPGLDGCLTRTCAALAAAYMDCTALRMAAGGSGSGNSAASPAEAKLKRVLAGPCVRHALLVCGLATLQQLEGGGKGWTGRPGPCACFGHQHGLVDRPEDAAGTLRALASILREATSPLGPAGPRAGPAANQAVDAPVLPRPAAAHRVLSRLGLAVAGGAVRHSGGDGATRGGGGGSSLCVCDGMPPKARVDVVVYSLAGIMGFLLTCPRHDQGRWQGMATYAWRLLGWALGPPLLAACSQRRRLELGTILRLLLLAGGKPDVPTVEALEEAPPSVAAALAGGALPLLERLLRRAGEDPVGPEASCLRDLPYGTVLPLLAHGEPLQANALLATLTKLLRRIEPQELLRDAGDARTDSMSLIWLALQALRHASSRPASRSGQPPSRLPRRGPSEADASAAGSEDNGSGLSGDGASSSVVVDATTPPGVERLTLVLALALPEWLAELSHLLWRAIARQTNIWEQEDQQALQELSAARFGGGTSGGASGARGAVRSRRGGAAAVPTPHGELGESALLFTSLTKLLEVLVDFSARRPTAAKAGGDGGDAKSDGSCEEWWFAGLEVSAIVPLVGAALGLVDLCRTHDERHPRLGELCQSLAYWVARLALVHPGAVRPHVQRRAAAYPARTPEWRVASAGALARVLHGIKGGTDAPAAKYAHAVAAVAWCLDAWAAGEEAVVQGVRLRLAEAPWWVERLVITPGEARRRLGVPGFCAHPACANLAGDSEAAVRLRRRRGCKRAAYYCRECQTAH